MPCGQGRRGLRRKPGGRVMRHFFFGKACGLCYTVRMEFEHALLNWYRENRRDLPWRRTRDPYAVWISEIMLQQTRVNAVIPYYESFLTAFPNVTALAEADDDRLMKLWQGLGYYSRAKNLKRAAIETLERFGNTLPGSYRELLTLPGIGSYTAGAIASIAYNERVPAVDGNVLRVMARIRDDARDVMAPKTREAVFSELLSDFPADAGTFNQALMELGAMVCVPNGAPLCAACPVKDVCRARQNGTIALRPVKSKKAKRTIEPVTVFALFDGERFLVRKRRDEGLLAGLYELPNVSGTLNGDEAAAYLDALGARPIGEIRQYERKHIFTHREWHMRVYACAVQAGDLSGYVWYDGTQSLPTAFGICLPDRKEKRP